MSTASTLPLIETIRSSVIGRDATVDGPFGPRPIVYADYTASGRALTFIEEYISTMVLPLYANTHTESSETGLQTTRFREEARQIIAAGVVASSEHAVVFCGSGATAAIAKIVDVLGLRIASSLDDRFELSEQLKPTDRPVVFIGPYEHHSNELPWRESIADVVTIAEDIEGHIDIDHLNAELERFADRELLIGSFSAASNVTGIMTDVEALSTVLHHHGALAFWDYAAAAPYVEINMGSKAAGPGYLDAVFISPHKFVGGPGTPGLLVARNEIFDNRVPVVPGGGTVAYVNSVEHDYLDDVESREEGGTPDIVGAIRAGLVFQLKAAVGAAEIEAREKRLVDRAISAWTGRPNIELLGNLDAERLSIVSFVVRNADDGGAGRRQYVHHNLVVAVLNDLFGIQSRGGCSCAGPYGHRLLGIDLDRSHAFEREITRGCEGIKPGWVRVNFNYFIDDDTADYIIRAVELIADNIDAILPMYRFDVDAGTWAHRDGLGTPPHTLHVIDYRSGAMDYPHPNSGELRWTLAEQLERAEATLTELRLRAAIPLDPPTTSHDFEELRWFPYPVEAIEARRLL